MYHCKSSKFPPSTTQTFFPCAQTNSIADIFWRRKRLRRGLVTLQESSRIRQSIKGVFAWQRLRITRQAFWQWQLCVFVHGGVHVPTWEVLGGRGVAWHPSTRSYARQHLGRLKQAVGVQDRTGTKLRQVSSIWLYHDYASLQRPSHSVNSLLVVSGRVGITIVE